MHKRKFFKEFIKNPLSVGSITPSSAKLANKMLEKIQADQNNMIVELGAGTGAVTRHIINLLKENDQFVTFEINPQLTEHLKEEFPNLTISQESAEDLSSFLKENNYPKANHIISGLPWAVFNEELQNNILNSIQKSLTKNGVFVTFAYAHALKMKGARKFRQKLGKYFHTIETSTPVWKNVPPAIVYYCAL